LFKPAAASSRVFSPPALPMIDGRSPSRVMSARSFEKSSLTAGPAPRAKVHSTSMPSGLNSFSSKPWMWTRDHAPYATTGRPPMPTPGLATRITRGLSSARAALGAKHAPKASQAAKTADANQYFELMGSSVERKRAPAAAMQERRGASTCIDERYGCL
jgi:hypothetical protein